MFAAALHDQVRRSVKLGRYSLLLGAGFSASSQSLDGTRLPIGNELAEELSRRFNLPAYPLPQLTDAIDPKTLDEYFQRRFHGCRASAEVKLVSTFVWSFIFTFNVDDVLVDCYDNGAAVQKPRLITFRDPFQDTEDLAEIRVIHLHGSVRKPEHGYIFSAEEYGGSIANDGVWFKIATDQFLTQPLIVIGATLAEPDLEYYLARRKGMLPDSNPTAPSFFVSKSLDRVLETRCKRFGLIPVQATADEFLGQLSNFVGERPTPLDLVLPKEARQKFKNDPTERSQRIFFRQWIEIDSGNLPELHNDELPLLRGTEPTWGQLKRREDIIRRSVKDLVTQIIAWNERPDEVSRILFVSAAAGEGKSAILMRAALELEQSHFKAFYFVALERLVEDAAFEVLSNLTVPYVLFVDGLAEQARPVAALAERLNAAKARFFLVGAERTQRFKLIKDAFRTSSFETCPVKPLNTSEALDIVQRLRAEGLLGRDARFSDDVLARRLDKRDLLAGIISLGNSARRLASILVGEWQALSEESKRVYGLVALAHAFDFPVKLAVVQRASQLHISEITRLLDQELRGIVRYLPPLGEYLETRHRRVSETLVKELPKETSYNLFVELAKALAPYVNRNSVMKGNPEARLSRMLLDYDLTVSPQLGKQSDRFYREIHDGWAWNSRYWEQRALLEVERDSRAALQFAEHAVGIEHHPLPLTTLAKVHFRVASSAVGFQEGQRHIIEGIKHAREAIRVGIDRKRVEVHPYDIAIRGVLTFINERKGMMQLDPLISSTMEAFLTDSTKFYRHEDLERFRSQWEKAKKKLLP